MVALLLIVAVAFPLALLQGWVLSILWGWFIVPVFNAPSLPVVSAAGIALIITFLTQRESSDRGKFGDIVIRGIVFPLVFLFFGWLYHLFL